MKTVAVIGAGPSGLTAIKTCLEEGLSPTCFEKTSSIGGLWQYRDEVLDGVASVMESTIINTSKEFSCFSDFPPPRNFPNYMPHEKVLEYFNMYAENFKLDSYITFKTEVVWIERFGKARPAKWIVITKNLETQKSQYHYFDGVMVCVGHHAFPHIPYFRAQEDFQGRIIHSHDYKIPSGYEDKRVVVVGVGNSGLDIAVELGRICSQVYLVTRRGAWIVKKVGEGGLPLDFTLTRFAAFTNKILPFWLNSYLAEKSLNSFTDHNLFSLKPSHSPLSQTPSMQDEIFNRIVCGSVIVKPNIYKFTSTGIIFDDNTEINDIDEIILCTGYNTKFPFLEESVAYPWKNKVNLYKFVFSPNRDMSTIAIIGLIQPTAAIMPVSEMQARWAARVFKGFVKLPSEKIMNDDIAAMTKAISKRYVNSQRHTIQVDLVPYMDSIASFIGVKPNMFRLAYDDFDLALALYFGPSLSYQYRLFGPGKWSKARDTILTGYDRVYYPFKTGNAQHSNVQIFSLLLNTALIAVLIVTVAKLLELEM